MNWNNKNNKKLITVGGILILLIIAVLCKSKIILKQNSYEKNNKKIISNETVKNACDDEWEDNKNKTSVIDDKNITDVVYVANTDETDATDNIGNINNSNIIGNNVLNTNSFNNTANINYSKFISKNEIENSETVNESYEQLIDNNKNYNDNENHDKINSDKVTDEGKEDSDNNEKSTDDVDDEEADTDIYNKDSDGDGLSDLEEIFFVNSNYEVYDSLEKGIPDALCDNDRDGINNRDEIDLGINPNLPDSDDDGLSDSDEIKIYLTIPNVADSDDDGLSDGDEVLIGLNPLLKDTDGDGIIDSEEKINQKKTLDINNSNIGQEDFCMTGVEIELNATGYVENTTKIYDVLNEDIYLSEVQGLIGSPVSIETTSKFDTAKISFCFNNMITDDEISDTLILWYDEENDSFVEQDTFVNFESRQVYTKVSHFSKYLVVKKSLWREIWNKSIDYINSDVGEKYFDEKYKVDTDDLEVKNSGSKAVFFVMGPLPNDFDPVFERGNYPEYYGSNSLFDNTCYRYLAFENVFMTRGDKDIIALGIYDNYKENSLLFEYDINTINEWVKSDNEKDYDALCFGWKNCIFENYFPVLDWNYMPNLNNTGVRWFLRNVGYATIYKLKDLDVERKDVVLICDSSCLNEDVDERLFDFSNENNVSFNVILYNDRSYSNLNNQDDNVLKELALNINGRYFEVSKGEGILDACNSLYLDENMLDKSKTEDTDKDGLLDIYERNGMRMSNGNIIYTNPLIADTDGDGLLDGEEINVSYNIVDYPEINSNEDDMLFYENNRINNPTFISKLNPIKADSDGDGLLDGRGIYYEYDIVLPTDKEPNIVNVPEGFLDKHLQEIESGERIARESDDKYSLDLSSEYTYEKNILNALAYIGSLGANLTLDDKHIALHAQFNTWQEYMGYNKLYDKCFRFGTNDNIGIFKQDFSIGDSEYRIWAWKGDYLNLGSGAEIGIYKNMNINSYENIAKAIMFSDKKALIKELKENGIDMFLDVALPIEEGQWEVDKDYALDMKLYLYNYYDKYNVQNIFAYEPYGKQWWITGFNPNFYNPDVNDMMMVGVIDLKDDKEDVYDAIKKKIEYDEINKKSKETRDKIYLEDNYKKIWLIWMGK